MRLKISEIKCCLDFHKWEPMDIPPSYQGIISKRRTCTNCGKTQVQRPFLDGFSQWITTRNKW